MQRLLLILCSLVLVLPALAQKAPPMARPPASANQAKIEATQAAKLAKEQSAAKAAYMKHMKDAKARKRYVASTVDLGVFYVSAKSFPPRIQYPTSLRYFREALKVDPTNKVAKSWRDQIESIYKSMGKPIPPQ